MVTELKDRPALAPAPGAANVTITPASPLLPASRTVTWSGAGKAAPIAVVCGVPPVATIDAAAPAVLVSAKVTGVATPAILAVTL